MDLPQNELTAVAKKASSKRLRAPTANSKVVPARTKRVKSNKKEESNMAVSEHDGDQEENVRVTSSNSTSFFDIFTDLFLLSNFMLVFDEFKFEDFEGYIMFKQDSKNILLPIRTKVLENVKYLDFTFLKFNSFSYFRCLLFPGDEVCSHLTCSKAHARINEIGICKFYSEKLENLIRDSSKSASNGSLKSKNESELRYLRSYDSKIYSLKYDIVCGGNDKIYLCRPNTPGIYCCKTNIFSTNTLIFSEEDFSFENDRIQILSIFRDSLTYQVNAILDDSCFTQDFHIATLKKKISKKDLMEPLACGNNILFGITVHNFKNSVYPPRQETEKFIKAFLSWFGFGIFEVDRNDEIRYLTYKLDGIEPNMEISDMKGWAKVENPKVYKEYDSCKTFFFISSRDTFETTLILEKLEDFFSMNNKKTDYLGFDFKLFKYEEVIKKKVSIIKDVDVQNKEPTSSLFLTPIVIKPNGLASTHLETIYNCFQEYGKCRIIKFTFMKKIPDEIFNNYYPNCLQRGYGKEWQNYMYSGPVLLLWVDRYYKTARMASLTSRTRSKLPWTKNIIHCPENLEELNMNTDIFNSLF